MTDDDPKAEKDNWARLAEPFRETTDFRETIYVIESPHPEDLIEGRNEGDALVRVLKLAEIDVVYFLVVNAEMFDKAFEEIGTAILNQTDLRTAMPVIHISAHGAEEGIELTDFDVVHWEKLSSLFAALHKQIGPVSLPPVFDQNIPKFTVGLSSCSAYSAYRKAVSRPTPFQAIVGPTRDIGWCESLLAFSAFYYVTGVKKKTFQIGVLTMNFASGNVFEDSPAFATWNYFEDGDEPQVE
jgi:hypothetical protein